MRRSTASIAVIRRRQKGQTVWLAQWNESWKGFHFVGGHKHDDESHRECVIREVGEELGLSAPEDFHVAEEPLAQISYTAWSQRAQKETLYTMELFEVELDAEAESRVGAAPENRWLTESEIHQQRCADGQPVSPTMLLLFNRARLWSD